jgi:pseudouridine-5'-phosphate glycosidase
MNASRFEIAPRVRKTLEAGGPVVALESTIIAHGMPYPANLETALAVEKIVADGHATPATIGILNGRVIVGMTPDEIGVLATQSGVWKTCERDIPMAMARQANAATTAGASLAIAAASGIRVFVTGGIGAVGPQASGDFDISADLPAIAGYPAITVCAGAKAFMDVAATLEWLETHRVPVATWRSQEFPLFFCRHSGCRNEWAAESAGEIAAVYRAQRELGVEAGLLVAVPLPESEALEEPEARAAINEAFEWAKGGGVTGKQLTPFLLGKISELTGGRSLHSNVALIRNNAEVGAGIAVALSA